ncbi:MAG: hypothetical protein ACT4O2_15675, partial [Beijerinckiaceae bacterium]
MTTKSVLFGPRRGFLFVPFAILLVSVSKVVESYESFVIQGRRPDSRRSRRCGRKPTEHDTIVIT